MEKEYTELEKIQAIKEYEKSQKSLYIRGKIIITVIAVINVVSAVISAVLNFNVITLVIQIALSIALFCGVTWIRYLFAVGSALSCLMSLFLLLGGTMDIAASEPPIAGYLYIAYIIFWLCYSLISTILLFKSKAVTEFLYSQRNG